MYDGLPAAPETGLAANNAAEAVTAAINARTQRLNMRNSIAAEPRARGEQFGKTVGTLVLSQPLEIAPFLRSPGPLGDDSTNLDGVHPSDLEPRRAPQGSSQREPLPAMLIRKSASSTLSGYLRG